MRHNLCACRSSTRKQTLAIDSSWPIRAISASNPVSSEGLLLRRNPAVTQAWCRNWLPGLSAPGLTWAGGGRLDANLLSVFTQSFPKQGEAETSLRD
jgi:hypothetical protein